MYSNKFYISFTNELEEFIEIYFSYLNYVGSVYTLGADSSCLVIRSLAGDENKQEPILGSEATIRIRIDTNTVFDIIDITAEHDLDARVTIYMNKQYSRPIFQGYVMVEDNYQPYLDKPFTIEVRATDGLGLLKGTYFIDENGSPYAGKQSILSWIVQCLGKTGQTLNLRTYFNISHISFPANTNPLENMYIDSIMFATGQQTPAGDINPADFNTGFDDALTALTKLVTSIRCKLFQEDGYWHLVNLYEYLNPAGYSWYEYSIGAPSAGLYTFTLINKAAGQSFDCSVGFDQIIFPIKETALNYIKLATKSVEYTYNYDQSLNKICNQDLSQGQRNVTYDRTLSSSIIDPTITPVVNLTCEGIEAFCWDHFDGTNADVFNNPYPSVAPAKRAYTSIVLDQLDYELERFFVIERSGSLLSYLQSSQFFLDQGDAFQMTVDFRRKDSGDLSDFSVGVFLTADDGTFWALNGVMGPGAAGINNGVWFQTDSNFRTSASGFNGTPMFVYSGTGSGAVWVTLNTAPLSAAITPRSGTVRVIVTAHADGSSTGETWVKNISITITPYLVGSYKSLKGDFNYSTSSQTIKQIIQDTVVISDSPKRYFKGALLAGGSGYQLLSAQWQIPGVNGTLRFTQAMQYIIYSHFVRRTRKIEGDFKGYIYPDPITLIDTHAAGLLCSYTFPDSPIPTKKHMLTSFEKDYSTCQWRGVFVETLKDINDTGLIPPDSFIFAYLFNNT